MYKLSVEEKKYLIEYKNGIHNCQFSKDIFPLTFYYYVLFIIYLIIYIDTNNSGLKVPSHY